MYENTNLPLIPESKDFNDSQNANNVNQYNSSSNEFTILENRSSHIVEIIILLVFLGFGVFSIIMVKKALFTICTSTIILIILILIFYCLTSDTKKLKLIKDQNNNKLKIETTHTINCLKSTLIFNLQDVVVDIIKYESYDDTDEKSYINKELIITSTFANDGNIDLNLSNIKTKPVEKIYYIINNPSIKTHELLSSIVNFINNSNKAENPVFFNIYKYMGKKDGEPITFSKYNLSKYMRMTDHFFSFYFKDKCYICSSWKSIDFKLFLLIAVLFESSFLVIPIIYFILNKEKSYLGLCIYILFIFIIPATISITFIILTFKHSLRMDIIYSKDFNKLFIGLLNYNGTAYKKTFLYELNLIDHFIVEPYKGSFNNSILKVVYKDRNIQEILRINENKYVLEGLLFILNKNLNNLLPC